MWTRRGERKREKQDEGTNIVKDETLIGDGNNIRLITSFNDFFAFIATITSRDCAIIEWIGTIFVGIRLTVPASDGRC